MLQPPHQAHVSSKCASRKWTQQNTNISLCTHASLADGRRNSVSVRGRLLWRAAMGAGYSSRADFHGFAEPKVSELELLLCMPRSCVACRYCSATGVMKSCGNRGWIGIAGTSQLAASRLLRLCAAAAPLHRTSQRQCQRGVSADQRDAAQGAASKCAQRR